MTNFHPNFPYGKGMWIWYLKECLSGVDKGSLPAIIKKCKDNNISYVIVKSSDGEYPWTQFTPQVIKAFHDAGIKIYSWSYVYGLNPLKEASLAIWALDMGVDGHVFNAEVEYKASRLPDAANKAKIMFMKVREKYPNAFLAHAPLPIIDYHSDFPYVEFGKYCDAVMPQMYYGQLYKPSVANKVQDTIMWTYEQWAKWEKKWKEEGHEDSIKPIIPLGQAYDDTERGYILSPGDIKTFIDGVRGYKSVNFWSFQHVIRKDCWDAIRDTQMDTPPNQEAEKPVVYKHGEWHNDPVDGLNKRYWIFSDGNGKFLPFGKTEPDPIKEEVKTEEKKSEVVIEPVEQPVVVPTTKPVEAELPAKVEIPNGRETTVNIKPNPNSPDGVDVKIHYHKTHLEIFLELANVFKSLFSRRGVK